MWHECLMLILRNIWVCKRAENYREWTTVTELKKNTRFLGLLWKLILSTVLLFIVQARLSEHSKFPNCAPTHGKRNKREKKLLFIRTYIKNRKENGTIG